MTQTTDVQGMYCEMKGKTVKCTVSMSDVSLTVYGDAKLFDLELPDLFVRFSRVSRLFAQAATKEQFCQDFEDLLTLTSKVNRTQMFLRSGQELVCYALGVAESDEQAFLYLTPKMREWWNHPRIKPIVESIQEYLPDFSPWLLTRDKTIGILTSQSSLL